MRALECFGASILIAVGCGGRTAADRDDGGGNVLDTDAGDAQIVGDEDGGVAAGSCSIPGGFAVCGGSGDCPTDGAGCETCLTGASGDPTDLGVCWSPEVATDFNSGGIACPDGLVLAAVPASQAKVGDFECVPFEIGQLYEANGYGDAVRYADYGVFTGDPLPSPSGCFDAGGLALCGGACSPCPSGSVCTGRSPNHPWSFCVPQQNGDFVGILSDGKLTCKGGYGCFRFNTEPAAVAIATAYAYCLPVAECQQAAANLPGGGTCVIPSPNQACFP